MNPLYLDRYKAVKVKPPLGWLAGNPVFGKDRMFCKICMMMAAPAFFIPSAKTFEPQFIEEKSIEEQILDLEDCIDLLEKIWMEDLYIQQEIDPYEWKLWVAVIKKRGN